MKFYPLPLGPQYLFIKLHTCRLDVIYGSIPKEVFKYILIKAAGQDILEHRIALSQVLEEHPDAAACLGDADLKRDEPRLLLANTFGKWTPLCNGSHFQYVFVCAVEDRLLLFEEFAAIPGFQVLLLIRWDP